jgi:hypothetical protein
MSQPEDVPERTRILRIAARGLLFEAGAYAVKWCAKREHATDWDKGYVRGMEAAAHSVANSIDRPSVFTEEGRVDDTHPSPVP